VNLTRVVSGGTRELVRRGFVRPRNELRRLRLIWRMHFNAFVRRSTVDVKIARGVRIEGSIQVESGNRTHTKVRIGAGSQLRFGSRLRLFGGTMILGDTVDVRDGATLTVSGGTLTFDGSTNIGNGVGIHCQEWIHVKKHGQISEHSTISDNAHFYTDPDVWSYRNTKSAPIDIGQDVWICPKSTITSGVTIGDFTIVASNTVVIKDTPGGVLVSGVPGKVVRELDLPWET
jgi:acetyltransferase-like isoleucine patch superfamily enzyme